MTKFKFFRGYIGTLNVMDSQTYATASLYNPDTIRYEDRSVQISRRIQLDEELRNHGRISNEQYLLNRDRLLLEERTRRERMVEHVRREQERWGEPERIGEGQYRIRLASATRVTTVNPTFKTKLKIFGTQVKLLFTETWRSDPIGVVVVSLLASLVTFIGIAKIFGA